MEIMGTVFFHSLTDLAIIDINFILSVGLVSITYVIGICQLPV